MKKRLSLILLLLFVPVLLADSAIWFSGTFDQAKTAAAASGRLLLIDFFSDG
ncbi:hypothetical protein JXO52_08985 [bacterium]|nr:hypothetical protein [bacterium]